METIQDFEDMLNLLQEHSVQYLIIGGLAFIFHAKPRYTKDMSIWIGPDQDNIHKANKALAEFGSPYLLDPEKSSEILQLGVAPDRIDLHLDIVGIDFKTAWQNRIQSVYGSAPANWIDLDSLIKIKSLIKIPRHQEDVRILKQVKKKIGK